MSFVKQLEILDELGQSYYSAEREADLLEFGDRVARNWKAVALADCTAGPDAVFSYASLMFAQVCTGLAPYRKKCPKKWMPTSKVLLEKW